MQTIEIPEGLVVLHSDLPTVYFLNSVLLTGALAGGLDAAAIAALADRWLGQVRHRFVRVDDSDAGARLRPDLERAGWTTSRTVFMVFRADWSAVAADPRARALTDIEHRAVMRANFEQSDYGVDYAPGLPELLVDAQMATRANTHSLAFGAGEDGDLQSMCTLYLDPDVMGAPTAMLENVGTLPAYQGRGLAKAVAGAAIAAAGEWGAAQLIIPADADDWPQLLYAGLGFEAEGIQYSFTRRPQAGGDSTCKTPP